jgi:branched-chain amino acid transport system permease protein
MHGSILSSLAALVTAGILLILFGWFAPAWAVYLLTIALAKGLVVLGLVILLRMGFVSFGQGLYYCLGAYVGGILAALVGITDAIFGIVMAGLGAALLGAILGIFLSAYRGVFFAMFNLALSMMLFGALLKSPSLGGSDGISIPDPSFFGYVPAAEAKSFAVYVFVVLVVIALAAVAHVYFRSTLGMTSRAVRDNEIRIEYLGASTRQIIVINYAIACGLAGVGGALVSMTSGHIIPELAYWTTSGEFVFIAVLSGPVSIATAFVASVLFEGVRLVASQNFPHAWQLILGAFLLVSMFFMPNGIGALLQRRRRAPEDEAEREEPGATPVMGAASND